MRTDPVEKGNRWWWMALRSSLVTSNPALLARNGVLDCLNSGNALQPLINNNNNKIIIILVRLIHRC